MWSGIGARLAGWGRSRAEPGAVLVLVARGLVARGLVAGVLILGAADPDSGWAADNSLRRWPPVRPDAVDRRALVIANHRYAGNSLVHPRRDGRAVSQALSAAGFAVEQLGNADRATLWRRFERFTRGLRRAADRGVDRDDAPVIGLIYFSGLGVQIDGANHLLPVDADIGHPTEIPVRAVPVRAMMRLLEATGGRQRPLLLVIDAAYPPGSVIGRGDTDAPLPDGLATPYAPRGILVMLSGRPGRLLPRPRTITSPFADALVAALGDRSKLLGAVLVDLRAALARLTAGRQAPFVDNGIAGDFLLTARGRHGTAFGEPRPRLPAAGSGVIRPGVERPVAPDPAAQAPRPPGTSDPGIAPAPGRAAAPEAPRQAGRPPALPDPE